jgi:hypothetical protein
VTVQSALTAAIPPGAILETLTRREPFVVAGYRDESMVLLLGPQRSRTPIPWQVWEELGAWLAARGWTELGAGRGQPTSSESLNGFLDARITRSTGSYVAAILVDAGLAEADGGRPMRIRWRVAAGRKRAARSGADAWAQIQAICREAMATDRTIATLDRGIANRVLTVHPNAIVRASDEARTRDGQGAPVRRSMVEQIWHDLADSGHARHTQSILYFAYALVAEIPGVAVDDDRRGLHIADWDLAMTPYQESGRSPSDAGEGDGGPGWPDAQIQPTIAAYFTMLRAELAGQPYIKADLNRKVQAATGRSRGAVEFKFANISAVLRDIGLPYVQGYKPRRNIQDALRPEVERFIVRHPETARLLEEAPAPELPATAQLFEVDPPVMPLPGTGSRDRGRDRITTGIDYLERQARNRDIGIKGERLVVEYERAWLLANGHRDLAELVSHVPSTLGDGTGYDVSSFLLDGSPHHIEVKTTRGSITVPFFLSENERLHALEHPGAYSIYRIFDLEPNPRFYKLTGDMEEVLDLTPVSYLARVKASGTAGSELTENEKKLGPDPGS